MNITVKGIKNFLKRKKQETKIIQYQNFPEEGKENKLGEKEEKSEEKEEK